MDFIDDGGEDGFNEKDAYGEWYPNLSLGKITGKDLAFGPFADFGLLAGVALGTDANTGLRSTSATEMENGYRMAVELLNERGGIQGRGVELVTVNDESDPDVAVRHYQAFVQRFEVLLGPYSSPVTAPVLDVTEAAGIPLVAPLAGTPTIWTDKQQAGCARPPTHTDWRSSWTKPSAAAVPRRKLPVRAGVFRVG